VNRWFERYGHWTLFFGYFVIGVRHFTAVVAGSSKMNVKHFALYAYSGGLLWVICFVSLGYFLGDQWERISHLVHEGAIGVVIAIAVIVLACVWWKRRH